MNHKFKTFDELFVSEQFDKKNKLNRSEKVITESQIENLENGLSLEMIEAMQVPIFKYKTQVTVHGHFPKLDFDRIGSYKNLIQNQNGSIGVKYNAIDFDKKKRIYSLLKLVMGATVHYNSTMYMAGIYKNADTKEKAIELYKTELEPIINRVDKTLFFGQITGGIGYVPFFGYFATLRINIAAIYEKNIETFVQQITGKTLLQLENIVTEHNQAKQAEREKINKEYEAQKNKERDQEKEFEVYMDSQKEFQKVNKVDSVGFYVRFSLLGIEYLHVTKKKKLQVKKDTYKTALEAVQEAKAKNVPYGTPTISNGIRGTFYKLIETETEQLTKEPETKKESVPNIEIVAYSDKAIAIFGDTKAKKDILKSLGAKFNPYLTKDGQKVAGWIAPKSRLNEFKNALM